MGIDGDFEIFFLKVKLNTWDFGEFFVEDEMNMVGSSRINQRTAWFIPYKNEDEMERLRFGVSI